MDGRVLLTQPKEGYRAATDPVFLAAAAPVSAGERVLDLGCGVGAAALCLLARVPGASAVGVEVQAAYAALARANAVQNGAALDVVTADLRALPPALTAETFDHVITNPPYFAAQKAHGARDPGRDLAHREGAGNLADFLDTALRRLRPGGWLTLIQRAERLGDVLAILSARAGGVAIRPLAPRAHRAAGRVVVRAQKGARTPLTLLPPLVIHRGSAHGGPEDGFTPVATAILRDAAPLSFAQAHDLHSR
ncbi:MAG: methyltransferase [Pseudomonadota bacterium]